MCSFTLKTGSRLKTALFDCEWDLDDDSRLLLGVCVCSFTLKTGSRLKTALFDCEWDLDDDSRLLRGVYEYGLGNWDSIKMDDRLLLYNKVCLLCLAHPVYIYHL